MLPEDARRRRASDEMRVLCDGGTLHGYSFHGLSGASCSATLSTGRGPR